MPGREKDFVVDESLDALRHPMRRRLLFFLHETTEGAGKKTRCELEAVFDYDDVATQIKLHHTHLPKLTDYSFIDWERGDRTAEVGPRWGDIKPILEVLYNHLDEDTLGKPSREG